MLYAIILESKSNDCAAAVLTTPMSFAEGAFLFLGGVYANKENRPTVPVALQAYLDCNPNTDRHLAYLPGPSIAQIQADLTLQDVHKLNLLSKTQIEFVSRILAISGILGHFQQKHSGRIITMHIRLFRGTTDRDRRNKYILTSKRTYSLNNTESLGEIVSHELDSRTARGVFYSFSLSLDKVLAYKYRHSEIIDICYVDLDLTTLASSRQIVSMHPVLYRDYWLCLAANSPDALANNYIINPATGRKHSLIGILNYSQRSVASWAHALSEIMLQCNGLQLIPVQPNMPEKVGPEEKEKEIIRFCSKRPRPDNIEKLQAIINDFFSQHPELRRRFLLTQTLENTWYSMFE